MSLSEILSLIGVLELPLASIAGLVGGYILFKKIVNSPEVQEWLRLLREIKHASKKMLEEYEKQNGAKT